MTVPVATTRIIIVCTVASKDVVNATLNGVDPTSSGDVMSSPLTQPAAPVTPIVGYWCSWATDNTTATAIRNAVRNAGWTPKPSVAERTVYEPGGSVPTWGSQRIWLFNGDTWTNPDDVLATLGLQRRGMVDG